MITKKTLLKLTPFVHDPKKAVKMNRTCRKRHVVKMFKLQNEIRNEGRGWSNCTFKVFKQYLKDRARLSDMIEIDSRDLCFLAEFEVLCVYRGILKDTYYTGSIWTDEADKHYLNYVSWR